MHFFIGWILGGVACFGFVGSAAGQGVLNYTTTWVGNSLGGSGGKHWGNDVDAMVVLPDGTCFTNTLWEEGAREMGRYRDGDVLPAQPDLHGWGRLGGRAIAANRSHLFLVLRQDASSARGGVNPQGGSSYPARGETWYAVRRYTLDGRPAPFSGGWGHDGSMRVVNVDGGHLWGVAATDDEVFVSNTPHDRVRVFRAEDLTWKRDFAFERPGAIRIDRDGHLWIVRRAERGGTTVIIKVDVEGKELGARIVLPPEVEVNDIAYDDFGGAHRLLVPDEGPDQRVRIYHLNGLTGVVEMPNEFLGVPGGILGGQASERGRTGPLRLMNPVACGVDAQGNYYIAQRQKGTRGMLIESYRRSGLELRWRGLGLEFVDCAQSDPASETDVFTKDSHYVMDFSRPAGQEGRWNAYTVDRFRYPHDLRLDWNGGGHYHPYVSQVRRIAGHRFLVVTAMHLDSLHGLLHFFRFNPATDGAIAIPSTRYQKRERYSWGLFVDFVGAVWEAGDAVHRTPMTGLDGEGNPTFGTAITWPKPKPFTSIQRVEYDATQDVLHLTGYTAASGGDEGHWGMVGKIYARYNGWTKDQNPDVILALPWNTGAEPKVLPKSMATFGRYLFVAEFQGRGRVHVYDTEAGRELGVLTPTAPANHEAWIDVPMGVRASRRANGEILVFLEDDAQAKVLIYRWRP
ncbi:MAG: SMP-30/gluconolactonase/LRE family protein [Candidatus Methylacidiphilales bacterium]